MSQANVNMKHLQVENTQNKRYLILHFRVYWPLKSMLIDLNMVIGINHKRVTIIKFQRIPLQQIFEGNYFYVN